MSQLQIHPHPPVQNANMPQEAVPVHNALPHADLPPEMQNARPARGSIFARVAAFFVGAGVGGGTTFGLGGGTLASSLIGAGATAAVGGTGVVTALATGGAALIGGALGLGLFVGIRALVNRIRRAPDPAPLLQNPPPNNLPQAQPAADVYNNTVANAVENGGPLPESLQQAANNAIAQMRHIYGEGSVPQGATLQGLLAGQETALARTIRLLPDNVSTQQMSELVQGHLKMAMPQAVVASALKPHCHEDANAANHMATLFLKKYPQFKEQLFAATTSQQVQQLLAQAGGEFETMGQIHQQAEQQYAGSMARLLSNLAQKLGVDVDTIPPTVNTLFQQKMQAVHDSLVMGELLIHEGLEPYFNTLADNLAQQYRNAFDAVDSVQTLSAETKMTMKMDILKSTPHLDTEFYGAGIAAASNVQVDALKYALDNAAPRQTVLGLLENLGRSINQAIITRLSPDEVAEAFNDNMAKLQKAQGAAFLAILDRVPGLRTALLQRQDLDVNGEATRILTDRFTNEFKKRDILAIKVGFERMLEGPQATADFAKMQTQTPILNLIKNADIPQELKTSWCAKVVSGAIANTAMAQALIDNVPQLPAETRPIMEQYILMQSYAPETAQASAQNAQAFAQEMAPWRNFNSAQEQDQDMAPLANLIKQDITTTIYADQEYDNFGISDLLLADAPRGDYTINGQEFHKDGQAVATTLRRLPITTEATKLVSSLITQRPLHAIASLGLQTNPLTDEPLADNVLNSTSKMASRNVANGLLHRPLTTYDMDGSVEFHVTLQNGRAQITVSELVGLDPGQEPGLDDDANGVPKFPGKARYTLQFECDLLGENGHSPSIESVHLRQEFLPVQENA